MCGNRVGRRQVLELLLYDLAIRLSPLNLVLVNRYSILEIQDKLSSKFKDPKMASGPSPPIEDNGLSDASSALPIYPPPADREAFIESSRDPSGEPPAREPVSESYIPI